MASSMRSVQSSTANDFEETQITQAAHEKVRQVFKSFSINFQQSFTNNFKTDDALETAAKKWANKIGYLTQNQIDRGIERVENLNQWTPRLNEFLRLACDLPTLEAAQARILTDKNTDLVSYRIRSRIGHHKMMNLQTSQLMALIKGMYEEEFEKALNDTIGSEQTFEPVKALPEQATEIPTRCSDETASEELAKMRHALGSV